MIELGTTSIVVLDDYDVVWIPDVRSFCTSASGNTNLAERVAHAV